MCYIENMSNIDWVTQFNTLPHAEQIALIKTMGVDSFLRRLDEVKSDISTMSRVATMKMVWITVNPRDVTSLEELTTKIRKFSQKVWVSQIWYSYEQRGDCEAKRGTGLHCHILVECNPKKPKKSPFEVRRETYSTFKGLVGTQKAVDIRFIPPAWKEDKLDYLRGVKEDPDKLAKIEQDKLWRLEKELLPIYHIERQEP